MINGWLNVFLLIKKLYFIELGFKRIRPHSFSRMTCWLINLCSRKRCRPEEENRSCYICLESDTPNVIRLKCGHLECIQVQLNQLVVKGTKVSLQAAQCGICKKFVKHSSIPATYKKQISDISRFSSKVDIYRCFSCESFYSVAKQTCVEYGEEFNTINPENNRCSRCSQRCSLHGVEALTYKCYYCCSPAVFSCYGIQTLMCDDCHNHALEISKGRPPAKCRCRVQHPPNGARKKFVLSCQLCTMGANSVEEEATISWWSTFAF